MNKLMALFDLFRKGAAVSDPVLWKKRSGLTIALMAVLSAAVGTARAFGYDVQVTEVDIRNVAETIAVIAGLFGVYATSDKVGIFPEKPKLPDDSKSAVGDPADVPTNPSSPGAVSDRG